MPHTPGPWNANEPPDCLAVIASDGREICSLEHDTDEMPAEEGEANARLIAAAPRLKAVLRVIVDAAQRATDTGKNVQIKAATWDEAKAALAEAEVTTP